MHIIGHVPSNPKTLTLKKAKDIFQALVILEIFTQTTLDLNCSRSNMPEVVDIKHVSPPSIPTSISLTILAIGEELVIQCCMEKQNEGIGSGQSEE